MSNSLLKLIWSAKSLSTCNMQYVYLIKNFIKSFNFEQQYCKMIRYLLLQLVLKLLRGIRAVLHRHQERADQDLT